MDTTRKRKSRGKLSRMRTFDYVNYAVMILLALIMAYPFWYIVVGAFSDGQDYAFGGVWIWPRVWSLSNFKVIFADSRLYVAFRNTVCRTLLGTFCSVIFTSAVGYAMSRKDLPCKKLFRALNVFTMFFSGGFIPYYLILTSLGFYDSFLVYIVPSLYSVSNMIIMCSFFGGIPEELHEAALMDGASEVRIWFCIYLPLSKSILATVALWLAVGHWNAYFSTMVYTRDPQLITLQYYLLKVIKESSLPTGENVSAADWDRITATTVSYAAIVVATIPILAAYPFIQRTFTNDVMVGAVKG